MNEVTRILSAVQHGDPTAARELLPLVYEELRKLAAQRLAQEKPGQTLQATALVHDAYLRLVDVDEDKRQNWNGRGHFFAAAAEAMRRILVERARRKARVKRGGGLNRVELDVDDVATLASPDAVLGNLFDGETGEATGVSADGSVIVGYSLSSNFEAFRWTSDGGMERLWDVMIAQGVDPAADGWQGLLQAQDISADGNTIVGQGTRNGHIEAFDAVVPEPGGFALLALAVPALLRRRRRGH